MPAFAFYFPVYYSPDSSFSRTLRMHAGDARDAERNSAIDGPPSGVALAILFRDELGFFNEESDDRTRAEIARFLATCPDCREPVAVPEHAVQMMSRWHGTALAEVSVTGLPNGHVVPDWSLLLRQWITSRLWNEHGDHARMTTRQIGGLRRLFEILAGFPLVKGDHVRNIGVRGWGTWNERAGRIHHADPGNYRYVVTTPRGDIAYPSDLDLMKVQGKTR